MSNLKHTPGPWSVSGKLVTAALYKNPRTNTWVHGYVAEVNNSTIDDEKSEANAKLIAAATEMLEALIKAKKRINNINSDNADVYIIITEAIKKATE